MIIPPMGTANNATALPTTPRRSAQFVFQGEEESGRSSSYSLMEDSAPPAHAAAAERVPTKSHLAQSEPVLPSVQAEPHRLLRRALSLEAMPYRGDRWAWLSNLAFFVATAFVIGSLLFAIGAGVSVWPVGPITSKLVTYSYFIGGSLFGVGAYLNFFQVINVGVPGPNRLFAPPSAAPSSEGYWGSLLYFVGAAAFEVAVAFALVAPASLLHAEWGKLYLNWLPQAVGGLCFTAAAAVEWRHNHDATPAHRVWWLCLYYLLGSALFWLAASIGLAVAAGWLDEREGLVERWGVDLPYLLGSLCFLLGGWMQLRMWKAQQFGLGFLREVNTIFTSFANPIDAVQQVSLGVYCLTVTLCSLNLALNHVWHENEQAVWGDRFDPARRKRHAHLSATAQAEELLTDVSGLVVACCMLLVATVVHQTPDIKPFDYLLHVMRGASVVFLASAMMRFLRYLDETVDVADADYSVLAIKADGPPDVR